jgi:hypothetical protein
MEKKKLGRFNYNLRFNFDEATYFTLDIKNYKLLNDLLERESCVQGLNRDLSKIYIPGLFRPKYNENADILQLYNADKNCELYHIEDCTVQIFVDQFQTGILITNIKREKKERALKTLEKMLA